jgi:hypothetical protein
MIKLYHFTNTSKLKYITPKYFGQNCYTQNDVIACKVKRSFFYTVPSICESSLYDAKFCYTAQVESKKLYNIQLDAKGYIKKYNTITEALQVIRRRYTGIIYQYNGYDIVSLFYSVSCKKISL